MVSQYLQNGQATLTTFWSTHWSDAEPGKDFFFFLPITSGAFSETPEMLPDWWRKGLWHAGVPRWACQTPAMGPAVRSCSQTQGTANSSCGLRKELFSLGRLAQASRGSLLLLQHWAQPPALLLQAISGQWFPILQNQKKSSCALDLSNTLPHGSLFF